MHAASRSAPVGLRRASLIGALDLTRFPEFYGARTVRFLAGPELAVMHPGVRWLFELVYRNPVRNPTRLAKRLKSVTDFLYPFGLDRGGMAVRRYSVQSPKGVCRAASQYRA